MSSATTEPAGDTLRWTLSFFSPYRGRTAVLALLALAEIATRALLPWPLKAIIDHVLVPIGSPVPVVSRIVGASTSATLLLAVVVAGIAIQLSHELVLLAYSRLQTRLAQAMVLDVRGRLFTHLQYLSLAHHVRQAAGEAVYRVDADAGFFENLLLRGLFPVVFSAITLVVMFVILLRLDAVLALVSMIVVPVLYLTVHRYMRRMQPIAEHAKELESRVLGRLYETLSAIRVVKTFAREEHEYARWSDIATEAIEERLIVNRHESLFGFMIGAITIFGSSLVLWLGGLHVLEGRLTLGTLLVVITYLGFVYGPMSAIATTTGSLHSALASARRVREVLNLPREPLDEPGAIVPARLTGNVVLDHVSFEYFPGRPVLTDVSLEAKPGETIALVGLSGAGKSTVASLIGRMYDVTAGRILIDGVDIRQYQLRALRQQIAVVLQEAILFAGSIGDNILYGRLDATDHEVVLAARAAHCEEFIAKLRRGFDTPIGEAGGGLSGGQRQRISIARAFLRDAPILILDEPTASLDTLSEAAVLAALSALTANRTTFVIAHRLSTVRDADRIVVLDAGRIVAQGTHDDLLVTSELYARLATQLGVAEARPERRKGERRKPPVEG